MKKKYMAISSNYFRLIRVTDVEDPARKDLINQYFQEFKSGIVAGEPTFTPDHSKAARFTEDQPDKFVNMRKMLSDLGYSTEVLIGMEHTSVFSTGDKDGLFDPDEVMCRYFAINKEGTLFILGKGRIEDIDTVEKLHWEPLDIVSTATQTFRYGAVDPADAINNEDIVVDSVQCHRLY